MRAARNLRLSGRALALHPLRTALAIAGIAVGVAGVVALTAVAGGARNAVVARFDRMGRNMLVVTAAPIDPRGGRARQGYDRTKSLRVADAVALRRAAGVARTAPAQDRSMNIKAGRNTTRVTVVGITADGLEIRRFRLDRGRFFTDADDRNRVRVVVLGATARTALFPDTGTAVGRTIRLGRVPFEVVGVLVSRGLSPDGRATEDDRVYIPLQTAMRRVFNIDYIKSIYLEGLDPSLMAVAEFDAGAVLRARHDIAPGEADDFAIQNQRVLLDAELATQTSFRRLIAGLGFLALVVGGSGIMSLMLLSVRERRHEIGLRVAVGARRRDIALQFLAESLLLAAAGGIMGIAIGALAAVTVSRFSTWPVEPGIEPVAISVGAAFLTGTISGVLPAWRAASLDPIAALEAR
jgi:putative ABC transport system permease protein